MKPLFDTIVKAQQLREIEPGKLAMAFNGPQYDRLKRALPVFMQQLITEAKIESAEEIPDLGSVFLGLLEQAIAGAESAPVSTLAQTFVDQALTKPKREASDDKPKPVRRRKRK